VFSNYFDAFPSTKHFKKQLQPHNYQIFFKNLLLSNHNHELQKLSKKHNHKLQKLSNKQTSKVKDRSQLFLFFITSNQSPIYPPVFNPVLVFLGHVCLLKSSFLLESELFFDV